MGISEKCFTYVLSNIKNEKPGFLKSPAFVVAGTGLEPVTFGL